LEKKVDNFKNQIKELSKEHPFWTKALISMLPDKLKVLFVEKKAVNTHSDNWLLELKNSIQEIMGSVVVPILALLFSL